MYAQNRLFPTGDLHIRSSVSTRMGWNIFLRSILNFHAPAFYQEIYQAFAIWYCREELSREMNTCTYMKIIILFKNNLTHFAVCTIRCLEILYLHESYCAYIGLVQRKTLHAGLDMQSVERNYYILDRKPKLHIPSTKNTQTNLVFLLVLGWLDRQSSIENFCDFVIVCCF